MKIFLNNDLNYISIIQRKNQKEIINIYIWKSINLYNLDKEFDNKFLISFWKKVTDKKFNDIQIT